MKGGKFGVVEERGKFNKGLEPQNCVRGCKGVDMESWEC